MIWWNQSFHSIVSYWLDSVFSCCLYSILTFHLSTISRSVGNVSEVRQSGANCCAQLTVAVCSRLLQIAAVCALWQTNLSCRFYRVLVWLFRIGFFFRRNLSFLSLFVRMTGMGVLSQFGTDEIIYIFSWRSFHGPTMFRPSVGCGRLKTGPSHWYLLKILWNILFESQSLADRQSSSVCSSDKSARFCQSRVKFGRVSCRLHTSIYPSHTVTTGCSFVSAMLCDFHLGNIADSRTSHYEDTISP